MTSQYKIYDTLMKRVSRAGFNARGRNKVFRNHGTIATYLCDLFLKFNGIVRTHDLLQCGVIKEGQTKDFLAALVKEGFISWDMNHNVEAEKHRYQTFAAYNLSDLINKEKGEESATKKDFILLKTKLEKIERCVKKLINHIDPPITKEKVEVYMEWSEDWKDKEEK